MQRKPFALKHSENNNFKIINTFYTTKFKVKIYRNLQKKRKLLKMHLHLHKVKKEKLLIEYMD